MTIEGTGGMQGPLAPLAEGFVEWLAARGYVSSGLTGQRALFRHLDRWLAAAGLGVADLSPTVLQEFLHARAAEGYVTKLTMHAMAPSLEYLAQLSLYAPPEPAVTAVERLIGLFGQHLAWERGIGEATAANHQRVARQFLAMLPGADDDVVDVAGLTAADVTGFCLARSRELSVAGMQTVVSGMRALLRFLYVDGMIEGPLASAVPTAARRHQELPRGLSGQHVLSLLQGCDRATAVGIRDVAILTMLTRLGLRAGEVADLLLDDIDWAAGQLRVRGKGPRVDLLPLPDDVGQAIVAYLQHARPDCVDRHVFIRSCAPRRGLSGNPAQQAVRNRLLLLEPAAHAGPAGPTDAPAAEVGFGTAARPFGALATICPGVIRQQPAGGGEGDLRLLVVQTS